MYASLASQTAVVAPVNVRNMRRLLVRSFHRRNALKRWIRGKLLLQLLLYLHSQTIDSISIRIESATSRFSLLQLCVREMYVNEWWRTSCAAVRLIFSQTDMANSETHEALFWVCMFLLCADGTRKLATDALVLRCVDCRLFDWQTHQRTNDTRRHFEYMFRIEYIFFIYAFDYILLRNSLCAHFWFSSVSCHCCAFHCRSGWAIFTFFSIATLPFNKPALGNMISLIQNTVTQGIGLFIFYMRHINATYAFRYTTKERRREKKDKKIRRHSAEDADCGLFFAQFEGEMLMFLF